MHTDSNPPEHAATLTCPGQEINVRCQERCWEEAFPGTPDQAAWARRRLAAFLDGSPLAHDAILCLSEIVSNAIQHSKSGRPGGTFTVRATLRHGSLRVEVEDQGGLWTPGRGADGVHGRGLLIVASLAAAWGIIGDGISSRTVWYLMHRP